MATLRSKQRNGRTYYTVRLRSGQELAAGWDIETARTIVAEHERAERLGLHGIHVPTRSKWILQDLRDWDMAQAELAGRETASRGRRWAVILDYIGNMTKIDTIGASEVESFTRKRLGAGVGPATVNRDRALLRVALARARNPASMSGYSGDPFAGIPPLEERRARRKPVPLPPAAIRALLAECWRLAASPPPRAVKPHEWRQNAMMIELAYLTASRLSQITHLRWDQVGRGWLRFPAHKRGLERHFRLTGRLRVLLHMAVRGPSEWVFPSARSAGPRKGFRRFWRLACKGAGVTGATPHTLRHSASSTAFARGAMIPDIQRLLGHTSPAMAVQLYTQLFPQSINPVSPNRAPKSARFQ